MNLKPYPDHFIRGELESKFKKFPKKEKEIIDKFLTWANGKNAGKRRLEEYRRSLIQIKVIFNEDFDNFSLDDVRNFLARLSNSNRAKATRNELKATLKRFLKFRFKDWSERFDNLEDIKLQVGFNEEKINENTIPTMEEIRKLVKEEPSHFWKTYWITMGEGGFRMGEQNKLVWDKIEFNVSKGLTKVSVYATKTHRSRSVFLKEAGVYLQELKKRRKDNNPLVFPAQRIGSVMARGTVSKRLNRLSKRVLGRSINPHLIRHGIATSLYKNPKIADKVVQKQLGHQANMTEIYSHLSSKDVEEGMNVFYNVDEEISEEEENELKKEITKLKDFNKHLVERILATEQWIEEYQKPLDKSQEELYNTSTKILQEMKKTKNTSI